MANWEMQLITAVIRAADPAKAYDTAIEEGLTADCFGGHEARHLWTFINMWHDRIDNFGQIPSEEKLREDHTSLDLPTPLQNVKDLCRLTINASLRRKADAAFERYRALLDSLEVDAVRKAIADLHAKLGAMQEQVTKAKDASFRQQARMGVLEDWSKSTDRKGVTGMPWPWEIMNEATQGIQPGDFVMFWALPKSMKTWLGLVVASHLYKLGYRVLVYSGEMTWKIVRNRVACIVAKLDYTRFKRGQLDEYESKLFHDTMDMLEDPEFPGELIFTKATRPDGDAGGPAEIQRKIDIYKPHFVMLDSAYMLEVKDNSDNPYDWKSLSLVNRRIKQICSSTGIPMLAIFQENERQALKYKNTRGTASMAMNTLAVADCDVGARLIYNKKEGEISIHLSAARETTIEGFTIFAHAASNFEVNPERRRMWTIDDVGGGDDDTPPPAAAHPSAGSATPATPTGQAPAPGANPLRNSGMSVGKEAGQRAAIEAAQQATDSNITTDETGELLPQASTIEQLTDEKPTPAVDLVLEEDASHDPDDDVEEDEQE